MTYNYRKATIISIVVLAAVRLFCAFILELGNDEAYYWLYSTQLEWNYFDHPPMIALWTRIFSANLAAQSEGWLRLGSVIACALSAWFLFQTVRLIHSPRAACYTALLYQSSFYAGITAGVYVMPDAPQMVFWTLSLWMIALIIKSPQSWRWWIAFGVTAGFCIMSKVHGVFLWMGMGAFILFHRPRWLLMPQVYVSALISAAIISPILIWNIQYDFATYRFHSARVVVKQFSILWKSFGKEIAGQMGFNNPVNVVVILSAFASWRRRRVRTPEALLAFNLIGLPLALLLLCIALFRSSTLPHWSGPAYVALLPLAGIYLAEHARQAIPRAVKAALTIFLVFITGYIATIEFNPGTFGSMKSRDLGAGDVTLDMYGWKEAGEKFHELYLADMKAGIMPAGATMVTPHWWGAHVEYYFARPAGITMLGAGEPFYLHHYLWLNPERLLNANTDFAYCIIPSDDRYDLPYDYFRDITEGPSITITRGGMPAHIFRVYRLHQLKQPLPQIREALHTGSK